MNKEYWLCLNTTSFKFTKNNAKDRPLWEQMVLIDQNALKRFLDDVKNKDTDFIQLFSSKGVSYGFNKNHISVFRIFEKREENTSNRTPWEDDINLDTAFKI